MANEGKSGKTVVRRVKAGGSDSGNSSAARTDEKIVKKVTTGAKTSKPDKSAKSAKSSVKKSEKPAVKRDGKKSFFLFRPIFAIGRYFRNSWRELRQVRWTNRRATWALTLAVILFSIFFALFILLFDWVFNWLMQEVIL